VIVAGAAPPSNIKATSEYFGNADWSNKVATFPVAACLAVELEITWWEAISEEKAAPPYFYYPLVVADPSHVQAVSAPAQGSITVLPICGGYASSGAPSTALNDSISSLLKEVQAIRSAQTPSKSK
jgi:hypothetical protein